MLSNPFAVLSASVPPAIMQAYVILMALLVVVNSFLDRRVVGLLTEAYVLRRYAAALEGRRRDLTGE